MSEQGERVGSELEVRASSDPMVVEGTVDRPADGTAESRAPAITRRDARVSRPPRHPLWLVNQLPVGMLNSEFFVRFVSIFQELAETLMDGADQIEHVPDATVTPTPLLAYLASWIDVRTVDPSLAEDVQRVILRSSAKALALRGTKSGLEQYLRMLSGDKAQVEDGGGVWGEGASPADVAEVAWVRMRVTGTGHLSEDEFVALVRDEIPAHVRAELFVGDRRVLSTVEGR
ncbi:MAG: hypothetical protein BGO26_11460 [Actinobacteria bacterium 69-20]|nr:phage tail protein [Actinomycetota bacterium]OJV26534.1 MAG: hypothetical protein BGO26_11460 [Actinobacteria bacterium 69-20]